MLGRKSILHIDDDAGLAALVKRVLTMNGYTVFHAPSAEEGLRKAKQLRPSLIILDMSMPGMSGSMAISQLVGADGNTTIPVLVFTAYDFHVPDGVLALAAGFLKKPCDVSEISKAVARIIGAADE